MAGEREVTVPFVAACPHCTQGPHPVEIAVVLSRGTLLFGGGASAEEHLAAIVKVTCPVTGKPFDTTVRVPSHAGEQVQGAQVVSAGEKSAIAEGSEVSTIAESRKASTSLARDAAGKLLAAGAAAVGAYFTILKFVGGEPAEGWSLLIGVLPAVGYLVVCLLAAVALRPVLMRVYGPTDFEQKLDKRLIQLNGLLSATVALFVLSTALSVVAYLTLWP